MTPLLASRPLRYRHVETHESILFKAILDAMEGLGVRVDRSNAFGYIDPLARDRAQLEFKALIDTTDFPTEVLGRAE